MLVVNLLLFIKYEAAGEYLLIEVLRICDVLAKRTAPRVQRFKASIFNLKNAFVEINFNKKIQFNNFTKNNLINSLDKA